MWHGTRRRFARLFALRAPRSTLLRTVGIHVIGPRPPGVPLRSATLWAGEVRAFEKGAFGKGSEKAYV